MTLAYLATPYSRYRQGLDAAFRDAAQLCGRLVLAGINAYSPIVHGHILSLHTEEIDPLDETFWRLVNMPMLAVCDTLIVAHLEGWEQSEGIAHEMKFFERAGKPVFDLEPKSLVMTRRGETK